MEFPPRPPWMEDLPGLSSDTHPSYPQVPCPATATWSGGRPVRPMTTDPRKAVVLGVRRHCAHCGYPLPRKHPVYRVLMFGGEYNYIRSPGGLISEVTSAPPVHRSCALYGSAGGCPALRYKTARWRGHPNRPMRGDMAVTGFRKHGMLFDPRLEGQMWGFVGVSEVHPLKAWRDSLPAYREAVEADMKVIDTSAPRLYWTDSPDDERRLAAMYAADVSKCEGWQHATTCVGGHEYRMQLLN